jgi:asparagine synthase (glutamine-hydrolysing)
MLARIAHRGPDGAGERQLTNAWLGHRRLAIVDPAGGGQPMVNGEVWLVGDGEVYNAEQLRVALGASRFRTRSDHEAALVCFDEEGTEAFARLWGMFAFVIAASDGRFVAARDSYGIAPLYWARRGETTLFASELKAFDVDWRPDVRPLPPGHAWTPADGLEPWLPSPALTPTLLRGRERDEEPPEWVFAAIRETLTRAVERMLTADVAVGALLSGGLDSSVVVAIAARIARREGWTLPTFAAGLAGSSDLSAARRVAEHVGTDHHERVYTVEEAIACVPDVVVALESFDPQLVHSAVPNHLVAQLVHEHAKVVLIGEGSDELFAGYAHYGRIETGDDLQAALLETIAGLHNLGLQRVDRITSTNALEARIPFLDPDLVELALALPPAWKLTGPQRNEKWLLRRAFDGWLPADVLDRRKEQFGEGTGMNAVLAEHFADSVGDGELDRERDAVDPPLRTREELALYRIFAAHFAGIDGSATIGRSAEA